MRSRGAHIVYDYDGRGRIEGEAKRVKKPGVADQALASRYAPRWYERYHAYDSMDRTVESTTGARSAALAGSDGLGRVRATWGARGVVLGVTGSHGLLVDSVERSADGLIEQITWGDLARTATVSHYDGRRRLRDQQTSRSFLESADPEVFPMLLQDEQYSYDVVNNPTEIHDFRIADEWPAGAKPVTRRMQYDDLYRVSQVRYEYATGEDDWVSPFAHELESGPPPTPTQSGSGGGGGGKGGGGKGGGGGTINESDPRLGRPAPHVAFAKRVLWQSFRYDWLGNSTKTDDDAGGFYDRSLGKIDNGSADDGPYQLTGASNQGASDSDGSLRAVYDDAGNLVELYVDRNGTCLGAHPSYGCAMRFLYEWDEVGRLTRARRWDHADLDVDAPGPTPSVTPFADLRYAYDQDDQRVTKTATDAALMARHTLYVFSSLEVRGTEWENVPPRQGPDDYLVDAEVEVPYLLVNGVRLGRVVYMPDHEPPFGEGTTHVFLQMQDHLGSTSTVIDRDSSELVERGTYFAYGAGESTYRPAKWAGFREDYRFTGKEEDVEVGLTYFGKRFYAALLGRWVSADPLEVHAPGEADGNLYAYVSGRALQSVDPMGLQDASPPVRDAAEAYAEVAGQFADWVSGQWQDFRQMVTDVVAPGAERRAANSRPEASATQARDRSHTPLTMSACAGLDVAWRAGSWTSNGRS